MGWGGDIIKLIAIKSTKIHFKKAKVDLKEKFTFGDHQN